MARIDITNIRSTIDFIRERDELLTVKAEVDPVCEISGIQKALDGGPAVLFEKIKGYPGIMNIGNVFSSEERTAAMFGVRRYNELKFSCLEAIAKPIPPEVIEEASCQEVIITDSIDLISTLPIIKHSEGDGAPVLGGGVPLVTALAGSKGSDLSFKRVCFRGANLGTIYIGPGSHLDHILNVEHKGKKIPLTINITVPPAVALIAAANPVKAVVSQGADELGMSGALQGSPVKICKARTVDAYAIANSEWVIEGYLTPDVCWETEEAERMGKSGVLPLLPEYHGYLGKAMLAKKLEITAITHRDRPIFYTPLADSYEARIMGHPLAEASLYQLAYKIEPDLVLDVNIPVAFNKCGVVLKVKKTAADDDEKIRSMLHSLLEISRRSLIVVVDEDIDIYSADDILWAIWTRGMTDKRMLRIRPDGTVDLTANIPSQTEGIVGMDATLPFSMRDKYKRAHYPVDNIELSQWFSEAEIVKARRSQSEYAQIVSKMGT